MEHPDTLRERVEALEHRARRVERRVRWWRGIACTAVMLGLSSWALPSSTASQTEPGESPLQALTRRLATLEEKLVHVTVGTNEIVITGANLRIVNGLGSTSCLDERNELIPDCPNGLGNLIVGYNESRSSLELLQDFSVDNRTGSHNIVVGQFHNFSSFGGLVVGALNEISNEFASVSGGTVNTASGFASSVSGGNGNTASSLAASISGGMSNTASGNFAAVSGGETNTASGAFSAVSGGNGNTASGFISSVSGGLVNVASGGFSSVSGGHNRSAPGELSWSAGPLTLEDF